MATNFLSPSDTVIKDVYPFSVKTITSFSVKIKVLSKLIVSLAIIS